METRTLRETIRETTRKHVEANNGMILGQCLSAVGWVNGTVPDVQGIVELPMTDVAGAGIAVGASIAGRRPILVIRFQDFLLLHSSMLVCFAARRKEIFGRTAPVFVRAVGRESIGMGPTHSGKLHSTFAHFPGLRLWAPITPDEWLECWNDYLINDDPVICFEHASTYGNINSIDSIPNPNARIALVGISLARMSMMEAAQNLKGSYDIESSTFHIKRLKPLDDLAPIIDEVNRCGAGLVIDSGFESCGLGRDIAYQLMLSTGKPVHTLGMKDTPVGCSEATMNPTPTGDQITAKVLDILGGSN